MQKIFLAAIAAAIASLPFSASSFAHATFERAEAAPGSSYTGVLRIPHGCEGQATHTVRLDLPPEIVGVKPMPKPGWKLATYEGDYERPIDNHGRIETKGVRRIVWSGGDLPDAHYDEFVFTGTIRGDAAGGTIYAPVVQECANGRQAWIEIPKPGDARPRAPAPGIRLVSAAAAQPVQEQSYRLGDLTITAPWTRVTPKGAKVAGGYLRITNTGKEPDRLTGGTFDLSARVEVHEMAVEGGVMRMRQLSRGLEIKPGQTMELKPGGYHLMFMDMKGALEAGKPVKGRLTFEKAGTIDVEFHVAPLGATSPMGAAKPAAPGGDAGHGHSHH
ncbi:MAG: DUF1775 domain-containing protein [Beijerinckiaceae bacterium]